MSLKPINACGKVMRAFIRIVHFKKQPDTVIVYGYPKFVFFWPLLVLGFMLWAPTHYGVISPTAAGWIYVVAFSFVLIAVGFELSRDETLFAIVCIVLVWVTALYLNGVRHITFINTVFTKFIKLAPNYGANMGLVISIIMSVFAIVTYFKTRLNSRWVFTKNEIEHQQFGRTDITFIRGAKCVSYQYHDTMELLLLGAGSIVITDPTGRLAQAQIDNVPFLKFRERTLDKLSESVAVSNEDDQLAKAHVEHTDVRIVRHGATSDGDPIHHQ